METINKEMLYRTVTIAAEADMSIQAKLSAVLRVLPYIEANCEATAALAASCRENLE